MSPDVPEPESIAVFGLPDTRLGERVTERVSGMGFACHLLSLDAPLRGLPVTVRGREVVWEGVALSKVGAALLEAPVFPWPQPLLDSAGSSTVGPNARMAEREARSLSLSALLVAARESRMVNPPDAFHLAASPAHALERLVRAGLDVHPWRIEPAPAGAPDGRLARDVAGRDRWHVPRAPAAGQTALVHDPVDGEPSSLFVVGETVVGALRFADGEAWARGQARETQAGESIDSRSRERALRALGILDLEVACVSLCTTSSPPKVLSIESGPDLELWDQALEGAVAEALAEHLAALLTSPRRESSR